MLDTTQVVEIVWADLAYKDVSNRKYLLVRDKPPWHSRCNQTL
jgi:hypothetical protein